MLEMKPINVHSVSIPFDVDKFNEDLKEHLKQYQGYIVSSDNSKEAKEDLVKLNKLIKNIDDERKKIKKIIMEGYNEFEDKIKSSITLIEQPRDMIKSQLGELDQEEIRKKQIEIENLFNASEINQYCTLSDVYNLKWENKGYKLTDIARDLEDKVTDIKNKLASIELIYPENKEKQQSLKIKFMKYFDLDKAITEMNKEEETRNKLLRKEKDSNKGVKEAQEETKREESINILEDVKPLTSGQIKEINANMTNTQLYSLDIRLTITKEEADFVYNLLRENNISFRALGKAVKVNRL